MRDEDLSLSDGTAQAWNAGYEEAMRTVEAAPEMAALLAELGAERVVDDKGHCAACDYVDMHAEGCPVPDVSRLLARIRGEAE